MVTKVYIKKVVNDIDSMEINLPFYAHIFTSPDSEMYVKVSKESTCTISMKGGSVTLNKYNHNPTKTIEVLEIWLDNMCPLKEWEEQVSWLEESLFIGF